VVAYLYGVHLVGAVLGRLGRVARNGDHVPALGQREANSVGSNAARGTDHHNFHSWARLVGLGERECDG